MDAIEALVDPEYRRADATAAPIQGKGVRRFV
jgi:hypothetical protein